MVRFSPKVIFHYLRSIP